MPSRRLIISHVWAKIVLRNLSTHCETIASLNKIKHFMTYWLQSWKQPVESQMTKFSSLSEYKYISDKTKKSQIRIRVKCAKKKKTKVLKWVQFSMHGLLHLTNENCKYMVSSSVRFRSHFLCFFSPFNLNFFFKIFI